MKDRDCESCKKFSRVDPLESEGYCDAKRTWVDPQEGEDCKMHEFTLHSATKYKDGTPIMTEPERVYCETDSALIHGKLSNQLDSLGQRVDELSEEYDTVLKTHGDTLEQHKNQIEDIHKEYDMIFEKHADKINNHTDTLLDHEHKLSTLSEDVEEHLDRICELEHMYASILDDIFAMRDRLCKITDLLVGQDEFSHIFSNFCGNCIHAEIEDGLCICALSGEALDPDYASCSRFDPSFTHVGDRPDWMEKIRKDLTTPSEPTEGCKDCKCAVDGMCVKYNCSLGAICATPECHEPAPF